MRHLFGKDTTKITPVLINGKRAPHFIDRAAHPRHVSKWQFARRHCAKTTASSLRAFGQPVPRSSAIIKRRGGVPAIPRWERRRTRRLPTLGVVERVSERAKRAGERATNEWVEVAAARVVREFHTLGGRAAELLRVVNLAELPSGDEHRWACGVDRNTLSKRKKKRRRRRRRRRRERKETPADMENRPAPLRSRRVCRFCLTDSEPLSFIYERDHNKPFQVPLALQIMSCVAIEVSTLNRRRDRPPEVSRRIPLAGNTREITPDSNVSVSGRGIWLGSAKVEGGRGDLPRGVCFCCVTKWIDIRSCGNIGSDIAGRSDVAIPAIAKRGRFICVSRLIYFLSKFVGVGTFERNDDLF